MGITRRNIIKKASCLIAAGALASAVLMTGCSGSQTSSADGGASQESATASEYPLTIAMWDGDGNAFEQTFKEAPERVVTLTDSTAEIMCRLGLADKVVGTVEPEAAMPDDIADEYAKIPVLGDKKTLSREVIIGSDPDVVLGRAMTFTAANQTDPESYNGLGVDLYVQTATAAQGNPTLQGVIDDVKNIAAIFDEGETGTALVEELEDRLAAIEDRLDAEDSSEPQSVLIMTGLKDGTFGTFGGATGASLQFNMIEMMGGTMASTQSASGLTYENLIEFNPDVIFYVTAERNKDADATAVETLYNTEALQSVPAIADKRVIEIPYAEFMDAGPRVFNAAETVLNALHPEN